ncbi:hypothetical protein HK096_004115 [Nowakowskiella sp. JEL0078]|nr:hypothetical protein HK096_004115 [Nowakowskiella sp. JEL0078]
MIVGRATADGTKRIAKRFTDLKYSVIPKTGLSCSKLGFGAHRISEIPENKKALEFALQSGINVVDTAPQFQSEKVIGNVLTSLFAKKDDCPKRDELILVSKAGFASPKFLEESNLPQSLFAKLSRGFQSLHPKFLEASITKSLKSLNVETIDILMLDCPERLLVGDKMFTVSRLNDEIGSAFDFLDLEVDRELLHTGYVRTRFINNSLIR